MRRTRSRVAAILRGEQAVCPGVRAVVDGRGGAGQVGGLLLQPVPGAGLSAAAGVAFWCCGNAVGECPANISNPPFFLHGRSAIRVGAYSAPGSPVRCPTARKTCSPWWEARFGESVAVKGRISSKTLVPLRSVVHDPMSHGRLYLLGDAAHIVPPMSAKGMNLALHDADMFAAAVSKQVKEQDRSLLEAYSATCLKHVWNYQAFAVWFTDLMHDEGDVSYHGEFRRRLARAEFERLYDSETANRLFAEFLTGLN
ncbi:FAD-dependent monooxygenase [Streptomyces sp. NPDC046465]|uniref:FAD-dependent monooxygenase n=1 Tax=Streptomyces sp. NPDC046465 TaxID=3155810 RepID=UPI0033E09DBE